MVWIGVGVPLENGVVANSGIGSLGGSGEAVGRGDWTAGVKKGGTVSPFGLIGEVAMGEKNTGSTMGFVTAVYSAVRNRRTPAGLGMTIISGRLPIFGIMMACTTSLTSRYRERLVK